MLGEKCSDAIYVDLDGKEHLPKSATRPDFTLLALQKYYRRLFLRWTWTFLASLCFTVSLIAALLMDLQLNGGKDWLIHAHGAVIGPGIAITSFYMMMNYRNKLRGLAATIQANPIQDDTT
jgi:hypothetical protein